MVNFLLPSVVNPTAVQRFTQSFSFVWVPAAEYAVDTFFFISGFLSSTSVLRELAKPERGGKLSGPSYLLMVASRWARLAPVYAAVLLWYWKLLPSLLWGPLWMEQFTMPKAAGNLPNSKDCDGFWWTNLLFVNNLKPWEGPPMCAPWTWYLAVDMQLFLLVPFIATLALRHGLRKGGAGAGFALKAYAPCALLVVVQIVSTWWLFEEYGLTGSMVNPPGYFGKVYEKPWTRSTPYAAGIALAMFHFDRCGRAATMRPPRQQQQQDRQQEDHQQQQQQQQQQQGEQAASDHGPVEHGASNRVGPKEKMELHFRFGSAVFLGGVAVMLALFSARFLQYRCTRPKSTCDAWFGLYLLGGAALPNWAVHFSAAFAALAWPVYSVALAAVSYALLCGHDPLRVKWLLGHPALVAPARLTYSTYLMQMPLTAAYTYSQSVLPVYSSWNTLVSGLAFFLIAMFAAFLLYLLIEKPSMNLYAKLVLGPLARRSSGPANGLCRVRDADTGSGMGEHRDLSNDANSMSSPLMDNTDAGQPLP